jgi:hypothetical protein
LHLFLWGEAYFIGVKYRQISAFNRDQLNL